ncbi:MAG: hypothetical protein HRU20_27895, partial [Pseudomonadales bacterium]|nr:hypothetical protein [Pseudomonadales bacterium]
TSDTLSFISPVSKRVSTLEIELTITDNQGSISSEVYLLKVNPVNALPTLQVTSPTQGYSNQRIELSYETTDIDGEFVNVYLTQLSGAKAKIENSRSNVIVLPIVDKLERLSFQAQAVDDEGGSVSETIIIEVSKPSNFVQIYYPAEGSLISGETLSVQGRVTEAGEGVLSDISIDIDGTSVETVSDTEGYWHVDDVAVDQALTNSTISVSAAHENGEASSHRIVVAREKSFYRLAQKHLTDCGSGYIFHFWPGHVVRTDCEGENEKTIASNQVGTGVAFQDYRDVALGQNLLVFATDSGLVKLDPYSSNYERTYVTDAKDTSAIIADKVQVDYGHYEGQGWLEIALTFTRNDKNQAFFRQVILETGTVKTFDKLNAAIADAGLNTIIIDYIFNGHQTEVLLMTQSGEVDVIDLQADVITIDLVPGRGNIPSPLLTGDVHSYYIASQESNTIYYNYMGQQQATLPESLFSEEVTIKEIQEYSGSLHVFTNDEHASFSRIAIKNDSQTTTGHIIWGAPSSKEHIQTSYFDVESNRLFFISNTGIYQLDLDIGETTRLYSNDNDWGAGALIEYDAAAHLLYIYSAVDLSFSILSLTTLELSQSDIALNPGQLIVKNLFLNKEASALFFQGDSIDANDSVSDHALYKINLPFESIDNKLQTEEQYSFTFNPGFGSHQPSDSSCVVDTLSDNISTYNIFDKTLSNLVSLSNTEISGKVGALSCPDSSNQIFISQSDSHDIYKLDVFSEVTSKVTMSENLIYIPLGIADALFFDAIRNIVLQIEKNKIVLIDVASGERAKLPLK